MATDSQIDATDIGLRDTRQASSTLRALGETPFRSSPRLTVAFGQQGVRRKPSPWRRSGR